MPIVALFDPVTCNRLCRPLTMICRRKSQQTAADESLLDNGFAIKPYLNVPLFRHTNQFVLAFTYVKIPTAF
jgi:hypothetical protein